MSAFVRHIVSLCIALGATWWFLFHAPAPALTPSAPEPPVRMDVPQIHELAVAPAIAVNEKSAPEEPPANAEEEGSAPPPPEAGTREGDEDGDRPQKPDAGEEIDHHDSLEEAVSDDPPQDDPTTSETDHGPKVEEPLRTSATELSQDDALLEVARKELSGEAKYGFTTSFRSRPEDQLAIARAFGEPVVLVPRAALASDASARSFELDLARSKPRVKTVKGRPPLERYRQYRDLFSFEYARLPEAVRELRTSIVRRDEVYLFAALIPASEWAVVIGRRREALERLSVDEDDVEEFVMTYVREANGTFDIAVDSLRLTSGKTIQNTP